ncbi:MAG: enoyl-CoA hydratase/isomerase family protein, partial [Burkholderiaceae bacterium]
MYNGRQVSVSEHSSNVALLTFGSPTGYVDDDTERELVEALDSLKQASRLSVVVITGKRPGTFMRHYDTLVLEARARQMKARGLQFDPDKPVPEVGIHRVLREIEQSGNTYIAAINGTATGTGYELALACDLRLAQAGDYFIGLPEVHLGLLPGSGGTQRLTRLVGEARALELLLLGDTLSPADARAYGLVNDVVDGDVIPVALQLAEVLAEKPARARAHIKRLVRGLLAAEPGKAGSQSQQERLDGFASERTLFCDLLVAKESLQRLEQVNAGVSPV